MPMHTKLRRALNDASGPHVVMALDAAAQSVEELQMQLLRLVESGPQSWRRAYAAAEELVFALKSAALDVEDADAPGQLLERADPDSSA